MSLGFGVLALYLLLNFDCQGKGCFYNPVTFPQSIKVRNRMNRFGICLWMGDSQVMRKQITEEQDAGQLLSSANIIKDDI